MGRDHADGRLFSRRAGLAVARVPEKTGPPKRHNALPLLGKHGKPRKKAPVLGKHSLCSVGSKIPQASSSPSPPLSPNNSQPVAAAAIALAALNLHIPTAAASSSPARRNDKSLAAWPRFHSSTACVAVGGWAGPRADTQLSKVAFVWSVIPGHGNFGESRGSGAVPGSAKPPDCSILRRWARPVPPPGAPSSIDPSPILLRVPPLPSAALSAQPLDLHPAINLAVREPPSSVPPTTEEALECCCRWIPAGPGCWTRPRRHPICCALPRLGDATHSRRSRRRPATVVEWVWPYLTCSCIVADLVALNRPIPRQPSAA